MDNLSTSSTSNRSVTNIVEDVINKYQNVTLSQAEAEVLLTRAVTTIVDRISDLEAENRRLGIIFHFAKSELESINERKRKDALKRAKEGSRPKSFADASTQEPEVTYQSKKSQLNKNKDSSDPSNKDCDNEELVEENDFGIKITTFGRLFDPEVGLEEDPFDLVQQQVLKRLAKSTKGGKYDDG